MATLLSVSLVSMCRLSFSTAYFLIAAPPFMHANSASLPLTIGVFVAGVVVTVAVSLTPLNVLRS